MPPMGRQHPILIPCPVCGYDAVVYHMEWTALTCLECQVSSTRDELTIKNDMRPKSTRPYVWRSASVKPAEGAGAFVWMFGCGCFFWAIVAGALYYLSRVAS